jgi:hypothetical protein
LPSAMKILGAKFEKSREGMKRKIILKKSNVN